MLQSIRENIKGVGAWVIVIFLCIPFAFWGINQYFDTTAENVAATVNGEEISTFAVDQAYQQRYQQLVQAFGDQLPEDLIDEQAMRREQLEQLVVQELLRQKMQDQVYRASDAQVREVIRGIPAFQENGEFSAERYRQALSLSGRSPAEFEAAVRRDLALQQLQQGIAGGEFATPREAAVVAALEEQGRRHSAIVVPDETFSSALEITEEDIAEYYEANQSRFLTEESVDLAYVELTRDRFASDVEVSEEVLREEYSRRSDEYASQEERVARHILVEGDGEDARAEAQAALERVRAGEDFATVAREVSDDPVSAEEGGLLGPIAPGQLEGAFEEALFGMEEGEVVGPVKTDFGYHVIKLDEVQAPELLPFEQVRDEIAADYRTREAARAFDEAVRQLADASFRDDASLETAADELDLEIRTVENVTRGAGSDIARLAQVRDAAFSQQVLEEGLNSDPIQVGEDRVLVVRVAEHQPAEPKPLAEVADAVREQLRAERATQMAREKAASVLERARAGESLADIARAEGLVYRDESVTYRKTPDIGPGYADALFTAAWPVDGPTFDMTAVENNDFVVFRLSEVLPGEWESLTSSERESRLRSVRQREAQQSVAAYLAEMRNSADVVVRAKGLQSEEE